MAKLAKSLPPVPSFHEGLAKQYERLCLRRRTVRNAVRQAQKQCDQTLFHKVSEQEEQAVWEKYGKLRQQATDAHRFVCEFSEKHPNFVRSYVAKHGVDVLACDSK